MTKLKIEHIKPTFHIWSSRYSPNRSRLFLKVPSNIVESCRMMVSLDLRSCRPTFKISIPSITILPPTGSIIGKSD